MSVANLLLLADGRFPDGAHAHSHGLEAAVDARRVHDTPTLADFMICRLWTSGLLDAATANLAAAGTDPDALDAAWCARTPSAVARATSRSLGRSLARTAARVVPDRTLALADRRPPVQPVAFGLLAAAIGCDPDETAVAIAHATVATLAAAGLRLLSLDPFDVAAVLADLRTAVHEVAGAAGGITNAEELPHASTPYAEIDVQQQASMATRLFRS